MTASDQYRRVEAHCPAFQARVASRALTRYYNACFRPFGITAEQFSLLVGIEGSEEPTIADLAARGGVDATTLSRSAKGLEQRDLVLSEGGRGRAGKRLKLTDAGQQVLSDAMLAWERARFQFVQALGEDALAEAGTGMARLAEVAQAAVSLLDGSGTARPGDNAVAPRSS